MAQLECGVLIDAGGAWALWRSPISDGFQATKPKKTVLELLDYSKAFDRVWREDLLIRAIDKGLPTAYAQWLRDFLSNRKT